MIILISSELRPTSQGIDIYVTSRGATHAFHLVIKPLRAHTVFTLIYWYLLYFTNLQD